LQADVDKLHAETSGIENEIKALQEKIMEVGGVKLRSQKAKVDDLRDQIAALNDRITTCDVARAKNEKDCEKFSKTLKSSEEELENIAEELAAIDKDIKQSSRNAEQVRKKVEDAEHVYLQVTVLTIGFICEGRPVKGTKGGFGRAESSIDRDSG
jgi:structural maintenance of chromosome 4